MIVTLKKNNDDRWWTQAKYDTEDIRDIRALVYAAFDFGKLGMDCKVEETADNSELVAAVRKAMANKSNAAATVNSTEAAEDNSEATAAVKGDLISRQEVLESIKELQESPWYNNDINFSFRPRKEAVEIVRDLCVKDATAVYPREWIEFDSPPKDNSYILLSFSNFAVPMVGRYEEDDQGGAYYIGDNDEPCIKSDMYVEAWMPLPNRGEVEE